MAKKRRDVFANRTRQSVTSGADASTAVFDTWETGMNVGQADPTKWVILGASATPKPSEVPAALTSGTDIRISLQIMIGEQTAMLDPDDMQLVSQCSWSCDVLTDGCTNAKFPLVFPILSPIPVFAHQMSIGVVGTNVAVLNSKTWYVDIWYVTAPIAQDEIVEYLAAFGQI